MHTEWGFSNSTSVQKPGTLEPQNRKSNIYRSQTCCSWTKGLIVHLLYIVYNKYISHVTLCKVPYICVFFFFFKTKHNWGFVYRFRENVAVLKSIYTPTSSSKTSMMSTFKNIFENPNKAGMKSGEITDKWSIERFP